MLLSREMSEGRNTIALNYFSEQCTEANKLLIMQGTMWSWHITFANHSKSYLCIMLLQQVLMSEKNTKWKLKHFYFCFCISLLLSDIIR